MRLKAILPLAANDEFRELPEPGRALAEGLEGRRRVLEELARERLRLRQSEQRRVRGLVVRAILAGRLAEGAGIAFLVEDVVHDLEREAHALRVAIEPLDVRRRERRAAMGAEEDRCANQRAGLEDV